MDITNKNIMQPMNKTTTKNEEKKNEKNLGLGATFKKNESNHICCSFYFCYFCCEHEKANKWMDATERRKKNQNTFNDDALSTESPNWSLSR